MAKIPHIMVDAFPLVDDHFSGVGHYTLGIVRGFDELAGEGKLTYSLISPRTLSGRLAKYGFLHTKKVIKNPIPNRVIRGFMKYKIKFPCDLLLGRGDYYFPSFLAWPTWFNKSSVVVHDVTYLAVPACVHKGNRDYLERVVPFSLKNSRNIISVSEFSKREIMKYYNLDSKKIFVAHPSVDRTLFYKRSPAEIHRVRAKYDIFSENYILSVGNIEPRKNYSQLVDAYISLPKKFTDTYPLIIVGAGGWNNEAVLKKIQRAKEDGLKIINPKQFVLDEDMPALYSGAKLLVFPTIYEGFGMMPLEAYACGTPVIASQVASVPEAAGKAAVYINPNNVSEISAAILRTVERIDANPEFMQVEMKQHLASLNWRKSAEITASAVSELPVSYFEKETEA